MKSLEEMLQSNVDTSLDQLAGPIQVPSQTPIQTPTPVQTPTQSKAQQLSNNTRSKVGTLASDADRLNYANAEQLQQDLSDAVDEQIFTRDDGSKYQIDYMLDNNGISQGTREVDYTGDGSKYGSRNLYIDDTVDGNMKLGLARADKGFMGRYTPGSDGYGWAPGPKGVTPEDGPLLDMEMPYYDATALEYKVHTNAGQIANRAIGDGPVTKQDIADYGSGKTEYTTPDAPMWNINSEPGKELIKALRPDTPMPRALKPYEIPQENQSGTLSGYTDEQLLQMQQSAPVSSTSRIGNLVDALQYGAGRVAASAGDAVIDTAIRAGKGVDEFYHPDRTEAERNAILDKKLKGYVKNGDFVWADKYKEAKEYGYDTTRTQTATKDLGDKYTAFVDNPSVSTAIDAVGSLANGLVTAGPEWAAESAIYMIATRSPLGLAVTTIGMANDSMEEIQKNMGTTDIGYLKRLQATGGAAIQMGLEKIGVNELVGSTKYVQKLIGNVIANGEKKTAANMIKTVAQKALSVTGKAGYEGLTEAAQQLVQAYSEKYGTNAEKELTDGSLGKEMFQAFGAGMGAGAVVSGGHDAVAYAIEKKKKDKENVDGNVNGSVDGNIDNIPSEPGEMPVQENYSVMDKEQLDKVYENKTQMYKIADENQHPSQTLAQADDMEQLLMAKMEDIGKDENIDEVTKLNHISQIKSTMSKIESNREKATRTIANAGIQATETDNVAGLEAFKNIMQHMSIEDAGNVIAQQSIEIAAKMAQQQANPVERDANGIPIVTTDWMAKIGIITNPNETKTNDQSNANTNGDVKRDANGIPVINANMGAINLGGEDTKIEAGTTKNTTGKTAVGGVNTDLSKFGQFDISGLGTDAGQMVDEKLNNPGSGVAADKVNSSPSKQEEVPLDTQTGKTDTHTEGFSERLIRALAKNAGLDAIDVQKTLNSAMEQFALRDMKSVSKASNEIQHSIYYDKKNGIIPTYTKYRAALKAGDRDASIKEIKKIQNKGFTQERKLNRYAVKYDELKSTIEEVRDDAIKMAKEKGLNEDETVARSIKLLKGADYKPAYSKNNLNVEDVSQDVDLTDGVRKLLGAEGKESNVMTVMRSIDESVNHIDGLLAAAGIGRKRDRGAVIKHQDDVSRYTDSLEKAKAEAERLKAIENRSRLEEAELFNAEKTIKNQEEGLSRIGKRNNVDSSRRWASVDHTQDVDALHKELTELKAYKRKTQEKKDRISEIEKILNEIDSETAAIDAVNKNMGKNAGVEVEGKKTHTPGSESTSPHSVVNEIRKRNSKIEKTVPKSEVVEHKEEGFQKKTATQDISKTVEDLKKNKGRRERITAKINKAVSKLDDKINDVKDNMSSIIGKDMTNMIVKADEAVTKSTDAISDIQSKIDKLKEQKKAVAKSVERTIEERAQNIAQSDEEISDIKEQMMNDLEEISNKLEEDGLTGESEDIISAAAKKLITAVARLGRHIKGLRGIAYRYMQKSVDSEISKSIKKLEKALKVYKNKLDRNINIKDKAYSDIKQNHVTETINGGKVGPNEAVTKAKMNVLKIRNLRKAKNGKITKRKALIDEINRRIQEAKDALMGTSLIDSLIENGLKSKKKTKASDKTKPSDKTTYEQKLDIAEMVDTRGTVLGSVPVDELVQLMDESDRAEFTREIDKAVKVIENNILLKKNTWTGKDGKERIDIDSEMQLYDSPMSGILYDKNGKVNRQAAAAIAMIGWSWAGANGASNLFNSKDDVARMRGYVSAGEVDAKEYALLKKAGSFRKVVTHSLGTNLMSVLGLSIKDDVVQEMEDKINADAGMLVAAYLNGSELIQNMNDTKISSSAWNQAIPDEALHLKEIESVPMVKSKDNKISEYVRLGKLLKKAEDAFDIDPVNKNYRTREVKKSDEQLEKVRGSDWSVPKWSQAILKKLLGQKHSMMIDAMKQMETVYGKGEEGRTNYLKAVGWKDIDELKKQNEDTSETAGDKMLQSDIDVQEAVNRELEHNYDELIDMHQRLKNGEMNNEVYFDWFFSKNGRYMMDSAGINPQSDKLLHRWLVLPSEMLNKVWTVGKGDWKYFEMGLAQGMGFGIDKEYSADIKKAANALLDEVSNNGQKGLDKIIEGVKSGEEFEIGGYKFEAEHPGHAMQAVDTLMKWMEMKPSEGEKFKATMVSEYDSITSGFANKLMQMPILGGILDEWMRKTGMFVDPKDNRDMNDIIASKENPDAYRSLVLGVNSAENLDTPSYMDKGKEVKFGEDAMKSLKTDWKLDGKAIPDMVDENGNVTSKARNLFKYPFMIFNYASSINTIRKNLSNDIAMNVMNGILNGAYDVNTNIMKHLGITAENIEQVKKDLMTKNVDSVFTGSGKGAKNILREVSRLINGTYGREVQRVMEEKFKPLNDANQSIINATKIMFNVFIKELEEKSEELKKQNGGRPLTKTEVHNLVLELENKFPLIKGPKSTRRGDGVAVIADKLADSNDVVTDKGNVSVKNQGGVDYAQLTTRAMVREFEQAHASGAVMPMHWIDGTIIGELVKTGGILPVHDAAVMIDDFANKIKALNKAAYDTGKEYNLLGEMLTSLMTTLDGVSDEDIANMTVDMKKDYDKDNPNAIDVVSELRKIVKESDKQRKKMYAKTITVKNFAGPSDTAYTSEPGISENDNMMSPKAMQMTNAMQAKLKENLGKIINKVMSEEC